MYEFIQFLGKMVNTSHTSDFKNCERGDAPPMKT